MTHKSEDINDLREELARLKKGVRRIVDALKYQVSETSSCQCGFCTDVRDVRLQLQEKPTGVLK